MDQDQSASGTPDVAVGDASQGKKAEDKVAYDTYKKTVAAEKAAKEKAKALEEQVNLLNSKLSELEQAKRAQEESKMIEKGDYQKILELREKEISELRNKYEQTENEKTMAQKRLVDSYKLQEFVNRIGGKLDSDYYYLVDLDSIAVNPETKEIDESSLHSVVSSFTKKHSRLIDPVHRIGLPANAAYGNGLNSPENFKNMKLNEMKKALPQMVKAERLKKGL